MAHNLDDFYGKRPKPRAWIYFSLFTFILMVWAHRTGADEITVLSDLMFVVSIGSFLYYCLYLVLGAKRARTQAIGRYHEFLSTRSKSQLEQLLTKEDVSPRSAVIIQQYLATHYPGT